MVRIVNAVDGEKEDIENNQVIPQIFAKTLKTRNVLPLCGKNELLQPWRYTDPDGAILWMLFLVKSAPSHYRRRVTIRETWAHISSLRGKKFATIFLLARTGTSEKEDLLREENDMYGDILQCDFIDSYKALPTKVLSGFNWLVEDHVTSDYVTVTDDDCVMNLVNISEEFRGTPDDVISCGYRYAEKRQPRRNNDSKWYVNEEMYPGKFYTYITGILRSKLTSKIDSNIKNVSKQLIYYPHDETYGVYTKMITLWNKVNKTLPWKEKSLSPDQPILTTYSKHQSSVLEKEKMSKKWEIILNKY